MITYLEYNHFSENPIVQDCIRNTKEVFKQDVQILTLEKDLKDMVKHCRQAQWALDTNHKSFVFDQIRLLLAIENKEFNYMDLDASYNLDGIRPNACALEHDGEINNGSWQKSVQNCKWNKYFFDLYQSCPEKELEEVNYNFIAKYLKDAPKDMKYIRDVPGYHRYLSWFGRLAKSLKSPCIYYTLFWDRAVKELYKGHDVIWLNTAASQTYFSKYNATIWRYFIIPMDLFQAQLDYSCGRHISLINLDNVL